MRLFPDYIYLFKLTLLLRCQTQDSPVLVVQSDECLTGDQEVTDDPRRVQQHSFMEIDHDIFSTVNLSLQEGQLSVSGKKMHTSTG